MARMKKAESGEEPGAAGDTGATTAVTTAAPAAAPTAPTAAAAAAAASSEVTSGGEGTSAPLASKPRTSPPGALFPKGAKLSKVIDLTGGSPPKGAAAAPSKALSFKGEVVVVDDDDDDFANPPSAATKATASGSSEDPIEVDSSEGEPLKPNSQPSTVAPSLISGQPEAQPKAPRAPAAAARPLADITDARNQQNVASLNNIAIGKPAVATGPVKASVGSVPAPIAQPQVSFTIDSSAPCHTCSYLLLMGYVWH